MCTYIIYNYIIFKCYYQPFDIIFIYKIQCARLPENILFAIRIDNVGMTSYFKLQFHTDSYGINHMI